MFAIDATGASTSANAAATAAGASPAALPVGAGGGKGGKGSKHGSTGTAAAGLPEVAGRGAAAAAGGTSSSGRAPLLRPMGSVKRQAGGHYRVAGLRFGPGGSLLACQSAGKGMELFRWVEGEGMPCPSQHDLGDATIKVLAAPIEDACPHGWSRVRPAVC